MGENALRLSDHKKIKTGYGDKLFYLRYEDRHKVEGVSHSVDPRTIENVQWRLSLPCEDHLKPGDYESHRPYIRYDKNTGSACIASDCRLSDGMTELFEEHPYRTGTWQLIQKDLGLQLNITCYHGLKDNTGTGEVSFGWNGKRSPFALCGVWNDPAEMTVCFTCVACGEEWKASFVEIQHLVDSPQMQFRLFNLCSKYWQERNPGRDYPFAMTRRKDEGKTIVSLRRWAKEPDLRYAVSYSGQKQRRSAFFRNPEEAFSAYLRD